MSEHGNSCTKSSDVLSVNKEIFKRRKKDCSLTIQMHFLIEFVHITFSLMILTNNVFLAYRELFYVIISAADGFNESLWEIRFTKSR